MLAEFLLKVAVLALIQRLCPLDGEQAVHEGTKPLCSRLSRGGLYCNGIDSSSKQMGQPLYCSYTPREKKNPRLCKCC